MPRFFVDSSCINDDLITIKGDDAHHISKALRMAAGEHIVICDMQGTEYDCVLESFKDCVEARIINSSASESESPCNIHLFQGLPKGDKLDTIIQKAVECGVNSITPFESERCIVKVKPDAEVNKTQRRCRIALEAAKQSGRGMVPQVESTCLYSEILERFSAFDRVIFCYESDKTYSLKQAAEQLGWGSSIAIVIGPEGGFSVDEVNAAMDAGAEIVNLGKRILRTETAAAFVLACLSYRFEL